MKKTQCLTEEQWRVYWKHRGIAFIILVGLIVINAFTKDIFNVVWARPITEATIIVSIPILYVAFVDSLIKPFSIKINKIGIPIVMLTMLVLLYFGNKYRAFTVVENGMISDSIRELIVIVEYGLFLLVDMLRKLYKEKNKKDCFSNL